MNSFSETEPLWVPVIAGPIIGGIVGADIGNIACCFACDDVWLGILWGTSVGFVGGIGISVAGDDINNSHH